MRYTHVVFDLDGTILNSLEDLADACNWVLENHGWPTHPLDAYRYFVGNGVIRLLERATPDEAKTEPVWEQVTQAFHARYHAHKADKTRPYEGLPELLDDLRGRGVTIAVLTNKPHSAALPIVEQYYPGVFHLVQGAVPEMPVKPDPALLHQVMAQIGARPEHTLFVGDSNVDIQTARNGGVDSCGVLWGFRTREELEGEGATYIAAHPKDIIALVLGQE
ncbi:MAG: HAD-IA family hydrolase [Oscillospiraceae bacterium]|nr:HAD-IA family hydrolase [Oscillospiraceae bacterium]